MDINSNRKWIDNLKIIGIFIIVLGHYGFYIKGFIKPDVFAKFGVGSFFLILGYNLYRSSKTGLELIFSRLFKLFFVGLLAAILQSSLQFYKDGNIVESNYLPFILGINTFFLNASVPGNPVLWFIGAYFDFVLVSSLIIKRLKANTSLIILSFFIEVLVRLSGDVLYDTYTFFLSWLTVFSIGMFIAQNENSIIAVFNLHKKGLFLLIVIITPMFLWAFNHAHTLKGIIDGIGYIIFTLILFIISNLVQFTGKIFNCIAKNTLIIFLFHCLFLYIPLELNKYSLFIEGIIIVILISIISETININGSLNKIEQGMYTILHIKKDSKPYT